MTKKSGEVLQNKKKVKTERKGERLKGRGKGGEIGNERVGVVNAKATVIEQPLIVER